MSRRRALDENEIEQFLGETEDDSSQESDSEVENHLSEDEVQSDTEDEFVDEAAEILDCSSDVVEPNQSSETTDNIVSSLDSRILIPSQRTLRGKNKYCWATSKGQSRGRTSAINIVRSARGPTRMCKNLYESILCFNLFMTDEIIIEIVRWTNVEISLKRQAKEEKDRRKYGKGHQVFSNFQRYK